MGIGPLRIGLNSEGVRHTFQNKLIHDWALGIVPTWFGMKGDPSPYFKFDTRRKAQWYWGLGYGTGNSLW